MRKKAPVGKQEAAAQLQSGSAGLALPYSAQKGSYLLDAGRLVYPVTMAEMLPNLGLLGRSTAALMKEFSGEWGRRLVRQAETGAIVFPDSLFSRALIYSLILESRLAVGTGAEEAPTTVPLCERQFGSFTHSMLKRFISSSLVLRLEAKSPGLADDLRAHIICSKAFALVFDVLTGKAAHAQYEKGLKSGNPYKPPESLEWICPGKGRGVGVNILQVAYMISRISPRLAHPELVSYVTGLNRNDMNVYFMGRLQDIFGIFRKFGINPNGDDTTAGYVLAKAACQAANTKIKHGMEIKEYLRCMKDSTMHGIAVRPQSASSKLSYNWLASGQVMFWQGIVDASRKSLHADAQKRLGEGAGEDAVQQFADYAGQFIFFKFRGCSELGLTQRHGLYRKIIENGILAIHEGDLEGLKREVQTLMFLSPAMYSEWAYLRNGRDSRAFGIFRDAPQLALCALGYISPADAARITKSLKMSEDEFVPNANEFREAHRRFSEIAPSLSGEFRPTAQEVCAKLDANSAKAIRQVEEKLGYTEPAPLEPWQMKEQHAVQLLEAKYVGKPLLDRKGNTVLIKMTVQEKDRAYAVLDVVDGNGKSRTKCNTALFVAREIRHKRLVPKKAKPGGP